MKVVILAGGFGTRILEESHLIPKPMIEIGNMPILWHIMKGYSAQGYHDFIICAGYKQHAIKEWFANYHIHSSDITFDFSRKGEIYVHNQYSEPWKVTIIDTGLHTMTGGRIKQIQRFVQTDDFMLTYGDGLSNINLNKLLDFHKQGGAMVTLSAVDIVQRFGVLEIDEDNRVKCFREKINDQDSKINAGYMVVKPEIFKYIDGNHTIFETDVLPVLANMGQLKAYPHDGFWQCMDTKREHDKLQELWEQRKAPWKIWDK